MKFISTEIPGVIIAEPDVHRDARGFFLETYHARRYEEAGIPAHFVQHNHSRSAARTLRGLHAQRHYPQGKLVRVVQGAIFDVAADIRPGSPTFGSYVSATLSAENHRQLYIPPGLAHGFVVIGEGAEVEYKCTDFYKPGDEIAIAWNDPDLGISWPVQEPLLSEKDGCARPLCEVAPTLLGKEEKPE